jgi:hypothetical protein
MLILWLWGHHFFIRPFSPIFAFISQSIII